MDFNSVTENNTPQVTRVGIFEFFYRDGKKNSISQIAVNN